MGYTFFSFLTVGQRWAHRDLGQNGHGNGVHAHSWHRPFLFPYLPVPVSIPDRTLVRTWVRTGTDLELTGPVSVPPRSCIRTTPFLTPFPSVLDQERGLERGSPVTS